MNAIKPMRQSNIESLRVLSMSSIIICHFLNFGGVYDTYDWSGYLMPVLFWGVDLFVLVSGYFLIKFKFMSIIRLSIIVLVFSIFSLAIAKCFPEFFELPSFKSVLRAFTAPISRSYFWFLKIYLGLMVMSPFLNIALKSMSLGQLRKAMATLTLIEVYSCWFVSS